MTKKMKMKRKGKEKKKMNTYDKRNALSLQQ